MMLLRHLELMVRDEEAVSGGMCSVERNRVKCNNEIFGRFSASEDARLRARW
ncbi:Hypothetical protein SMAX5B_013695 [Scophthalmus maximus]|uniref:Uncharacterized protein n=1 Tax=Scophthalmus maximus TaxID=52904 RepID=A0A2U9AZT6_SCOMX|nr:Hypothetical protein SMAX5B_013695 [Scophthalmus maximus]